MHLEGDQGDTRGFLFKPHSISFPLYFLNVKINNKYYLIAYFYRKGIIKRGIMFL